MKQINIHGGNMFENNLKSHSALSSLELPDNKSLPDVINEFFVSVSEELHPVKSDVSSSLSNDYCSQYIIHAQDVESGRRLSNINIHKAPGPDFLPSWIPRDFALLLA